MDGDERCSEAHLFHTHLHLAAGSDSRGAEEEMDGWVLSSYCTSCAAKGAAALKSTLLIVLFVV